jgi:hypothetical protein
MSKTGKEHTVTKLEEEIATILKEADQYKEPRERRERVKRIVWGVIVAALVGALAGALAAGLLFHEFRG